MTGALVKRALRHRHDERAHGVRDREADVAEQRAVELVDALRAIRIARGVHLLQHERMAANRALPEDDQAARQDVRAFHRDRDRDGLVAAAHVVAGAEADALAAVDVHAVVGDDAAHLGDVILRASRRAPTASRRHRWHPP